MNYYLLDSIKIDGDMEKNLTVMQKWLNEAGEWIIGFIPNIIAAVIFLIAGYWLIKLIVHIIHKALEKGSADHTIISFLVSVSRASARRTGNAFGSTMRNWPSARSIATVRSAETTARRICFSDGNIINLCES